MGAPAAEAKVTVANEMQDGKLHFAQRKSLALPPPPLRPPPWTSVQTKTARDMVTATMGTTRSHVHALLDGRETRVKPTLMTALGRIVGMEAARMASTRTRASALPDGTVQIARTTLMTALGRIVGMEAARMASTRTRASALPGGTVQIARITLMIVMPNRVLPMVAAWTA
jgi:hypothetical protein